MSDKIYLRSSDEKINLRDFQNFFSQKKFKHIFNKNSLFNVRIGTTEKNLSNTEKNIEIPTITDTIKKIENINSIFSSDKNLNPKSNMPQINLNRKIEISNALDFLEEINNNSDFKKSKITLKDLIIKASHISSLSVKNFRNYYLNDSIYYLKDFTIVYNNFSGISQRMELFEKKSLENYFENSEQKNKSFFLIEDAGEFDVKTVRPIISMENVF